MYKNLWRMSRRLVRPRGLKRALGTVSSLVGKSFRAPPKLVPPRMAPLPGGRVAEEKAFGSNPGALRMFLYLPAATPRPRAPLIVVLHGGGQHAHSFAAASGWTKLADRLGIPLVLPEQVGANNRGRCFNWFQPTDAMRDAGEAFSIRQMVAAAAEQFGSDPARVFVVGLSAGGAMAAALLAAYPDVFAAGAVVAGLPIGGATNGASALACMAGGGPTHTPAGWARLARAVGPAGYAGRWPRVTIWQGGADRTVAPANAVHLAVQWQSLHGCGRMPSIDVRPRRGVRRRSWGDAVELWTLDALAHGFPIDGVSMDRLCPDIGIDAAASIARFWKLRPEHVPPESRIGRL